MSKRLIIVLALAFVVGISYTAYAEVQNVKVSGDLTVSGVARNNFDLTKVYQEKVRPKNQDFDDKDADIFSIARVRVDADLTDNVSATVRLLNERNWNGEGQTAGYNNRNIGLNALNSTFGAVNTTANENDIDLDLAYVTLKEFRHIQNAPLSLTIGRQNLYFGNGLVVGDPDTNIYSLATNLAEGDLSARKSFDAIRATLDYNPLVLDVIYAKIEEGLNNRNDDVTLSGINASYELNKNTMLEAFMFNKVKGSDATQVWNLDKAQTFGGGTAYSVGHEPDIVNTIGVRAVDKSVNNLSLDATLAYQFGKYNPIFDPNARYDSTDSSVAFSQIAKRSAWAAQLKASYDLKGVAAISKYNPMVSAGYTYLSGVNRYKNRNKAYTAWDPMFEDQTEGHILNAILANTNMHRAGLSAKAKLTDDLTANLDYVGAWFAKRYPEDARAILSGVAGTTATTGGRIFRMKSNGNYIGQEIDATLTYDYTEDVQFSLLGGVLIPGKNIRDDSGYGSTSKDHIASATELIGSMKVTF